MEESLTPQINTALIAVNKEVEAIKKGRKNKEQGYSFRGIDDAYNELHDLFAKHGIIVLPKYIDSYREERKTKSGGTLIYSIATYEFTFMAEDGSREMITLQGEGMDTGDKSLNKAFSAALKYALFSMFLIPTDEMKDSETESHEVLPKQVAKKEPAIMPDNRFQDMMKGLTKNNAGEWITKARKSFIFSEDQEMTIKDWEDNLKTETHE